MVVFVDSDTLVRLHYCVECGVFIDWPVKDRLYDYRYHREHNRRVGTMRQLKWLTYRYIATDIIKKEKISGMKVKSQVKVAKTIEKRWQG